MKVFDKMFNAPIFLEDVSDAAVFRAACDLKSNLMRLSGRTDGFDVTDEYAEHAITVKNLNEGEAEAYTVSVNEDGVLITGADTLGTVYGIYAFATKCLKIPPVYRLTDVFPSQREGLVLENVSFSSMPRFVRFRGWFLNDEDLLTEFKISGGKRNIDYMFYDNVMDTGVLDMILETALRLEINLIIPSSFVDILNPAEEELVKTVVGRGMYISQHHVEPVGVSYFAADNYMKAHGYDEAVSFINNRGRMEEIWRVYVDRWAKYGKSVVWQLGLRGKSDQSVWKTDPSVPVSVAERGAIISDAIATQHKMITEALGRDDFESTATLWMEGAALYGCGALTLPKNTVAIFSDIGHSQMFGDDFYTTARSADGKYGVYYHVGFWFEGPHLSEGTDLQKMAFSYKEAKRLNSLYYSIANVSNVRPLHFGAWINARILADPENFDVKKLVRELLAEMFENDAQKIEPLVWEYYASIADLGKEELIRQCIRYEFNYHDYGTLPFSVRPITDGALFHAIDESLKGCDAMYTGDVKRYIGIISNSIERWECLYEKMCGIEISEEHKLYFEQFLKFETYYMLNLSRAVLACRTVIDTEDTKELDKAHCLALGAFDAILEARKILELNGWENWHRGDKKIAVLRLRKAASDVYERRKREMR